MEAEKKILKNKGTIKNTHAQTEILCARRVIKLHTGLEYDVLLRNDKRMKKKLNNPSIHTFVKT